MLKIGSDERSPLVSRNSPYYLSDDESVNSVGEDNITGEDEVVDEYDNSDLASSIYEPLKNSYSTKKDSWRNITALGFSSLGAIYGDIGTSPLYVLNTIKYKHNPPNKDDIYGAVSVIFYLFTLIVIVKYLLIVLVYGPNDGEGGQVAIYAKIARHLNIGPRGVTIAGGRPEKDDTLLLTRQITSLSFIALNRRFDQVKNSPRLIKLISRLILVGCFLGCSLVMADGLLTPTTSVLSAIQGIQVAKPEFDHVLIVSELVLVLLFVMQQFGSAKISMVFAPIIFCWLVGLFACGLYNIIVYHPSIWYALSPYYAFKSLRGGGVDVFSGAMLAITGTEAMFADIGHFGRLPVQLSLTLVVYPALMVCYLGQGAYIINSPEAIANPFFMSIPGGLNSHLYWIMFSLATLSTIIASQALILGVFSIISQLIHLDCFPKFKIIHVDKENAGKVYIPAVNWMLMVGVLATTAGFKTSENVTAAYGLGISLDFLVTSFLIMICMIYVYEVNICAVVVFGLVFIPLELLMVGANMNKVASGAWYSILMASTFLVFLYFWSWARSKKVAQEFAARVKLVNLFPDFKRSPNADLTLDLSGKHISPNEDDSDERGRTNFRFEQELTVEYDVSHNRVQLMPSRRTKNELRINSFSGCHKLKRYDGVGIMYTEALHTLNSPNTVPQLYKDMIESFTCIPSVFVFCAIKVLNIPVLENEDDRILVGSMKIPGHYRCIVRFGFVEEVQIQNEIISRIINMLPDTPALMEKFNAHGVFNDNECIPILHIFENELIQSHRYKIDRLSLGEKVRVYMRQLLINNIFSPINNAFRSKDQMLKIDDEHIENQKRLFLGSIVRI